MLGVHCTVHCWPRCGIKQHVDKTLIFFIDFFLLFWYQISTRKGLKGLTNPWGTHTPRVYNCRDFRIKCCILGKRFGNRISPWPQKASVLGAKRAPQWLVIITEARFGFIPNSDHNLQKELWLALMTCLLFCVYVLLSVAGWNQTPLN